MMLTFEPLFTEYYNLSNIVLAFMLINVGLSQLFTRETIETNQESTLFSVWHVASGYVVHVGASK